MTKPWTARPAAPADYTSYKKLFPELGVDDPLPTQERFERDLMARTIFLEEDGAIIAYALWAKLDAMGYIQNVVVDPAHRGRGVGVALMEAIAVAFRREGYARWCLNVKVGNTPAIRLYERFGFRTSHTTFALTLDWDRAVELPREPGELTARPLEPAEDAALERAFGRPAGRLQSLRARQGMVLLRLVDPAQPDDAKIGMAVFDPHFPGAPVFAVARPTLAVPLLDAIRPHARPGDAQIKLVIEADAPLVAALRAAGAEVRLELLSMQGDVPRR